MKEAEAIIQTPDRLKSVTGMWHFKMVDPSLDTPTAVLFNSFFLAMENIFEITANAVHHQTSKTPSKSTGNVVGNQYPDDPKKE
ncbi:hypothetical protein HDU85_004784 [Gaertneriomyces sp. JEL0708]|nr:hypothetical protein HDU85_004784 [Gaertneriomyces sp. JEL0708]